MTETILARAPAKLNLALSVGPPGVDRMHPISSWMVTINLFDDLLLTRLPDGSLSRYALLWHPQAPKRSDIDWSITRDLAVRAHMALQEHTGQKLPLQLKMEKRIPVGGGLGGGSSDAAAMLHGVNHLFHLEIPQADLVEIASGLGSDVAFLVHGGSAIVEGLGERVSTLPQVPDLHVVLAFPEAACPTGSVYAAFDRIEAAQSTSPCPHRVRSIVAQRIDPGACFNDLTTAALDVSPLVRDDLDDLSALADRPVHVSGSGSSLFVVCDDELHAETLATAARERLKLATIAARAVERPVLQVVPS